MAAGKPGLTNDDHNNWFPHISPGSSDGLSICLPESGEVAPRRPSFYKYVCQVVPVEGGPSAVIAYLYGGQGTINTLRGRLTASTYNFCKQH